MQRNQEVKVMSHAQGVIDGNLIHEVCAYCGQAFSPDTTMRVALIPLSAFSVIRLW